MIFRTMIAPTCCTIWFRHRTNVFESAIGIGATSRLIPHANGKGRSLHLYGGNPFWVRTAGALLGLGFAAPLAFGIGRRGNV